VPENYFGEDVAARYDKTIGEWSDPDVVERASRSRPRARSTSPVWEKV
jgi:hypothetical protein